MAHLWQRETNEDRWAVIPLESDGLALSPRRRRLTPAILGEEMIDAVVLLPMTGARGSDWVLISRSDAEVGINGLPLISGIRVLSDRDEISIGTGESYFFSTETCSPVRGLRPVRAGRCLTEKAPKPRNSTRSPRASAAVISLRMALTMFSTSR